MEQKWIKCSDRLPPEGHLVLGYFPNRPWSWRRTEHKNIDKFVKEGCTSDEWSSKCLTWNEEENPKYKIVALVRGISEEQRKSMPDCERKRTYMRGDEWCNNRVPYEWEEFGSDRFEGLECEAWCEINPYENAKTNTEMEAEREAKYGKSLEKQIWETATQEIVNEMDKRAIEAAYSFCLPDNKSKGKVNQLVKEWFKHDK